MPLLSDLIDLPSRALVSIVGAGGKTTTMYTLAHELAAQEKRVVTTTTTQIFTPASNETEQLLVEAEPSLLLEMAKASLRRHRHITIAANRNERGKLLGVPPDVPALLLRQSIADAVLIEADGARHRMIKAPADYEPVILPQTNVALLLMSAEAINQPLRDEIAHRQERIAVVTGIAMGDILTPEVIARLMTSEQGALKSVPQSARAYLLITHATTERRESVLALAKMVHRSERVTDVLYSEEVGKWLSA